MKRIILILLLTNCTPYLIHAQWYRHKSEARIAQMTPAQRVDEWVKEQLHHKYNLGDDHDNLIRKYVMLDGLKALPRLIEIIDEYDPTQFREGKGKRGERYDACVLLFGFIDAFGIRLRSSETGKQAIDALEHSIERMRKAGYGQPDQDEWEQHGRFDVAVTHLEDAKKFNFRDRAIKETLRIIYKTSLSETEMSDFTDFLIARYPEYPSWSALKGVTDETQRNSAGNPLQFHIAKEPERYYEVFLEFKKRPR
jgi:hypothetical protein